MLVAGLTVLEEAALDKLGDSLLLVTLVEGDEILVGGLIEGIKLLPVEALRGRVRGTDSDLAVPVD